MWKIICKKPGNYYYKRSDLKNNQLKEYLTRLAPLPNEEIIILFIQSNKTI